MEKLALGAFGFVGLLCFIIIAGPLFGGLSGWIVGFLFTDPILDFLNRLGVRTEGMSVWQIGVALGFIGAFFKATLTQKEPKK